MCLNYKHRKKLTKQQLGILPSALSVNVLLWGILQNTQLHIGLRMNWMDYIRITVVPYLYADYWMWMLHCFLDRLENLESRFGLIKTLAISFQHHHDFPGNVLTENHLSETNDVVTMCAGTGILLGYWTSPDTKLICAGICLWGSIGSLNHFYCHAITHGRKVPPVYKFCHRWCLLPTPLHHKRHHTSPHEENWNFLCGMYKVYEPIYYASGSSYAALSIMFYTCNPVCFQMWAYALGFLA